MEICKPSIIVAKDINGVIGINNQLPWSGKLKDEMKHFRKTTLGNRVIMGRKTYDSIGKPLDQRENIVMSRDKDLRIPGCVVFSDPEEALTVEDNESRFTYVIGGSKIYELFYPFANRLIITTVEAEFCGDAFFVGFDMEEWKLEATTRREIDINNSFAFTISEYSRII